MALTALTRRFSLLPVALGLALGAVACSGDDVGAGTEFSTDSFEAPTNHGELRFGVENPAEFTSDNRFHAWTFSLTGPADIDLTTVLHAVNLDTVMYLYRRTEAGWGSYIDKNDDNDGLLASRIAGRYDAGEYMIKVKATKVAMVGAFGVMAGCSGEGCPASGGGSCSADGPPNLPVPTGYAPSCDAKLAAILTTPRSAAPTECNGAFAERAVQYYKDYWNDVMGYEELTGGEDVEPNVSIEFHAGAGVIVDVGLGGDEDSMDFLFDENGKLLYYYQHNQSPDWGWYCEGEPAANEPDEDCFQAAVSESDYGVEDVSEASGSVLAAEAGALPPAVAGAIAEYAAAEAVAAATAIGYDYVLWAGNYVHGAEVALTAEGHRAVTYVLTGDPEWGMRIVFRTDDTGTAFVCKEPG